MYDGGEMGRIIVPRVVVRPVLPPPLEIGVRVQAQWLEWQVGRYKERLSFGPGGRGKADVWVPEQQGEQHNLILNQFYDSIIPQYGFVGASQYAAVGTGSSAPSPLDTQLAAEIGTSAAPRRSNSVPSGEANAIEPLATYGVYDIKRVYEFTEAQVGGLNLTEWGFSPVSTYNGPLMTRELFRDGLGNPIVLTLATDQRLRLIYRYRITLSPTTATPVTVNIGGDGPGPRTAQFLLTGMFSTQMSGAYYEVNFKGIMLTSLSSSESQRRGDLIIAEVLASGEIIAAAGANRVTSETAPLTYLHTVENLGSVSDSFDRELTYESATGRSRRASVLLNTSEAVLTIKSVILPAQIYSTSGFMPPTVNLVFDSGQEFTKDNLHKLLIAYWRITWGP